MSNTQWGNGSAQTPTAVVAGIIGASILMFGTGAALLVTDDKSSSSVQTSVVTTEPPSRPLQESHD